jgi:hypothetical protein
MKLAQLLTAEQEQVALDKQMTARRGINRLINSYAEGLSTNANLSQGLRV